jgi:hypothetical protein
VGRQEPQPAGIAYNAQAPAPALQWDVLVTDGSPDGYVLVTQSSAAEGVAWISPSSASLPSGAQNLVLATPAGASGTTSLRSLVAGDLPIVPVAQGGTGLSSTGAADQIIGTAHSGGGLEYKTLTAGANVTITPTAGAITIASSGGGGGGTPGGLNGQVQYDANGSFGGFTVSGDGTLNTSTGALTVTKTSGVGFAPSATTDTTNANNIGSGTLGVARGGTGLGSLTAHAVMLGEGTSTPGFVAVGTGGRLLTDQGSGADPAFVAMSGDATIAGTGALTIGASAITSAKIAASAVSYAKIQNASATTLLGNPTGSAAAPSEITLGANLSFSGTTLVAASGSAANPGGTANQVQYNSGGTAFGGFTMSGDATLVVSTGVITVSAGAITLAKHANLAASSLMGNPTGSPAAPSAITLAGGLSFSGTTLASPSGTVTSVSWTGDGVVFTASADTPVTSSGTLAPASLIAQTANRVFAGPSSAGPTAPTFRALVAADIPSLPASQITSGQLATAQGGTALSAIGTASQVLGVNTGATGLEYKTLTAGANVTITPAAGSITIASSGGASGYATIDSSGTPLTQRATVNFTGAGVTAVDNSGSSRTDVTIPATVTSVSWTGDGVVFTASADTPVTTSGTLTPSLIAQTAHYVLAGPTSAGPTAPTFRALAAADIPSLPASQITSGQLGVAQGGTSAATLTAHAVLLGEGTSALGFAAIGTGGRLLVDQGSGADPAFVAISGDATCTAAGALTVTKTSGVAFAASATTDTTNASNIASGTLGVARGGTGLGTLTAHAVMLGEGTSSPGFVAIGTAGRHLVDQGSGADPAFVVISGDATCTSTGAVTVTKTSGTAFAASATTDTTNASNIASGTLAAARLPAPTASTLGGVESLAAVTSKWINTISTSGAPSATQPAFTDISGTAAAAQLPTTGLTITEWVSGVTAATVTGTAPTTATTLNCATANVFTIALVASSVTTITLSGLPVGATVKITTFQPGTGTPGTLAWAGQSIRWSGGTAGQATATASIGDTFVLYSPATGIISGSVGCPNF